MAYWKCPACGFEAQHEKQKQEHMTRMASDARHAKPAPGMGGQQGSKPAPGMGGQQGSNPWQQQGGKGSQKP